VKRERCKPIRAELERIISRRPVVRKISRPREFRRFVESVTGGSRAREKKGEGAKCAKR